MGNRVKGKKKLKSIKTKALDKNSKRRLATLGKKTQKGHEGEAIQYITRGRAVKKLGITLRDFRRLCILKGIYPREPKNKRFSKTVYHVKDITFLAHEPLLEKFRLFKAYMKKVSRHLNRRDHKEANRMYEERPLYSLEHLVRERYPRFTDSLADLDDALCLIHLFSTMRKLGTITDQRTENCLRLTREWQLYVAKSRSLRKTFVSVKGIYYQADVMGHSITWIVPHKFTQEAPREVDFRVMSTFLEFYESLLGFVLFKLYHGMGLHYPPRLDQSLEEGGAHLACIQLENLANNPAKAIEDKMDLGEESESDAGEESEEEENVSESEQQQKSKKRIETLAKQFSKIVKDEAKSNKKAKQEQSTEDSGSDDDDDDVFAADEEAKKITENSNLVTALTNLFKGLTFWLSREVPFESLEFVIRSLGGEVLSEELGGNKNDKRITHFVSDRPNLKMNNDRCEYVQPQWVYDSCNFKILLPVKRYAPGASLPPHLSPFVNNDAVGYTPEYAEEIEKLQAAAGVAPEQFVTPKLLRDITRKDDDEDAEDDDVDTNEKEEEFVNDLKEELLAGERLKQAKKKEVLKLVESVDSDDDEESEEEEEEESEEEEEKVEVKQPTKKEKKKEEKKKKELAEKKEQNKKRKGEEISKEEEPVKKVKKNKEERFILSKRFSGSRPGYVFKYGPNGLGYYIDKNAKRVVTFKAGKAVSNRAKRQAQQKEEHDMRKMMMSGKAKRLYTKMQHGINRRKENAAQLKRRRK
uniref:Pescadillo homolog n=1 Tax=Mucochytrium quahogii TaxID=96639 RepID=A0A7S2REP5_9STRA